MRFAENLTEAGGRAPLESTRFRMQRSSVFSPFLQQAIRDYESGDTVQLPSLEVAFAVEVLYGGLPIPEGL
jgi:hypothetical protein